VKLLTVFLLCHDRPYRAVAAIESILQQTNNDFSFVISDNSSNNVLFDIVTDKFPSIEYISQSGANFTSFFSHFSSLLLMSKTQYVVMFHDDDIMEPNFVEMVLNKIKLEPDAAAIATNGNYIDADGDDIGNGTAFSKKGDDIRYRDRSEILQQYLAWDFGGIAPFCSYVYNLKYTGGLFLDYSRGRKYCDTVFLMDIINRGNIIWINKPLVKVRIHDNHISSSCGILDYKAFLYVVKTECRDTVNKIYCDEYRFRNLYYVLKRKNKWPFPALKYFFYNILKVMFYSRTFRRVFFQKITKLITRQ